MKQTKNFSHFRLQVYTVASDETVGSVTGSCLLPITTLHKLVPQQIWYRYYDTAIFKHTANDFPFSKHIFLVVKTMKSIYYVV